MIEKAIKMGKTPKEIFEAIVSGEANFEEFEYWFEDHTNNHYQDGYNDGESEGYSRGWNDGENEGYDRAASEGDGD